jgi:O-methyltransferase
VAPALDIRLTMGSRIIANWKLSDPQVQFCCSEEQVKITERIEIPKIGRKVWLFKSFEGLPKPDSEAFPKDKDDPRWTYAPYLSVSLEQFNANFAKYELLDERTQFVKGWFRDTIPTSKVKNISVLRLDRDMYESTWLGLTNIYPRLSAGGFAIIDDYGAVSACKAAVDDFRAKNSIASLLIQVDWTGVFWRK